VQTIVTFHPELLCIAKILSFSAELRAKEEEKNATAPTQQDDENDIPKSEEQRTREMPQDSEEPA
jgi:hypothetical protein